MTGFRVFVLMLLALLPPGSAAAQRYLYTWSGPALTLTTGSIPPGTAVTGSIVLPGPIENLPLDPITPVSFSFSAGPVTIDDATPLHPSTRIEIQTDASGEIVDAIIQLVEEGDASAMGGGLFAADVICVQSCDDNDTGDFVIDRDETASVIGEGDVAGGGSFWSSPGLVAPTVPGLSAIGLGVLLAGLALAARPGSSGSPRA